MAPRHLLAPVPTRHAPPLPLPAALPPPSTPSAPAGTISPCQTPSTSYGERPPLAAASPGLPAVAVAISLPMWSLREDHRRLRHCEHGAFAPSAALDSPAIPSHHCGERFVVPTADLSRDTRLRSSAFSRLSRLFMLSNCILCSHSIGLAPPAPVIHTHNYLL